MIQQVSCESIQLQLWVVQSWLGYVVLHYLCSAAYLENRQGGPPQEDASSYPKGARSEGRHRYPRSSGAPPRRFCRPFCFCWPPTVHTSGRMFFLGHQSICCWPFFRKHHPPPPLKACIGHGQKYFKMTSVLEFRGQGAWARAFGY